MMTMTTPFSHITIPQVTRALIARARAVATARGDTQIGFRMDPTSPYHTMAYTDPDRGPSIGDSTELRGNPIDDGDWIVRGDHWSRIV